MLERGSPNDMKVKLSDRKISANKDMLMARSKYFSLTLPRKASGTGAVDISQCSKDIIDKIIRFLFSGSLQFGDLSLDQILNLHHTATILQLVKLKFK